MVSLSLWVNNESVLRLSHGGFLPRPSQLVILRETFDVSVKQNKLLLSTLAADL